jgi:hypothetical protein
LDRPAWRVKLHRFLASMSVINGQVSEIQDATLMVHDRELLGRHQK